MSLPEHTSLVLGEGRLKIVTVHGEGKHGLLITPVDEPHEVNSKFHGECGQPADICPASINGVIAWFLGLEADNNELRALVKEQDETIKENTRAMAVGCRFREGLEGARKALESNQPHAALALIETALLYKP